MGRFTIGGQGEREKGETLTTKGDENSVGEKENKQKDTHESKENKAERKTRQKVRQIES